MHQRDLIRADEQRLLDVQHADALFEIRQQSVALCKQDKAKFVKLIESELRDVPG